MPCLYVRRVEALPVDYYAGKEEKPNPVNSEWAKFNDCVRMAKAYQSLSALLAERDSEIERLRPFARYGAKVIEAHRDEIGDIDGGSLQEMAIECGLLHEVEVTEPCDPESCRCAEWDDFPQKCLRYTEAAKAALAGRED